jgi:hypothetical protein
MIFLPGFISSGREHNRVHGAGTCCSELALVIPGQHYTLQIESSA